MLNRTDKNEYSHLVPNFKEKLCSLSPLSIIFPSMDQDHKQQQKKKKGKGKRKYGITQGYFVGKYWS
jgi:hypothetical protein